MIIACRLDLAQQTPFFSLSMNLCLGIVIKIQKEKTGPAAAARKATE